jgi:plasmid replication initiation protein
VKKTTIGLLLMFAIAAANTVALPVQDDTYEREAARQQAAREQAAIRAKEQAAEKQQKATQDWLNRERQTSDSRLTAQEQLQRTARAHENETKFKALMESAKELVYLSSQTYSRLNANGAQSISVTLQADLDRMEKLVKAMKKTAK